jgi:hypothetical protein
MDLLKNCQHNSSHYTYLIRGERGDVKAIEKKTFHEDGVIELGKEAEGLRWYAGTVDKNANEIIDFFVTAKGYSKLRVKYHNGEVISNPINPDLVINKIQSAVEHYFKVFGSNNYKYSHGDYFIGNVVFNKNRVVWIIDWEHFNDELPPGYDAVNLIVEVFISYYSKSTSFTKSSVGFAKKLLSKVAQEIVMPKMVLKSPVLWCRDTALNHKSIWRHQYNKLPHIACSYRTCLEIDKLLGI